VGRFGGEKFIALLDGAVTETATNTAVRITQAIRALTLLTADHGCARPITASIGVTSYPGDGTSIDALTAATTRDAAKIEHSRPDADWGPPTVVDFRCISTSRGECFRDQSRVRPGVVARGAPCWSGVDAREGNAMRSEGSGDSGEDTSSSVHRRSGGHHPGDLEGMVDELEQRVVAERRSAAAQGSAGRRGAAPRRDQDQNPD